MMSRGKNRARRRRARIERVRAEFEQARSNPEVFEQFLRRLAASDQSVWVIARSATTEKPLDDAETAMVAQIVAPHLAGMTPGSVHHRHLLAS
jgi:predicted kinase